MAHPYDSKRENVVERQRVAKLFGGTPKAGASDAVQTKKIAGGRKNGGRVNRASGGQVITGTSAKVRADRPSRASGGKVIKKQFGGELHSAAQCPSPVPESTPAGAMPASLQGLINGAQPSTDDFQNKLNSFIQQNSAAQPQQPLPLPLQQLMQQPQQPSLPTQQWQQPQQPQPASSTQVPFQYQGQGGSWLNSRKSGGRVNKKGPR